MTPQNRRRRIAIGLALGLAFSGTLLATAAPIGYAKDEGYYFSAARDNFGWFATLLRDWSKGEFTRPFSKEVVDRHWTNNAEHPPLPKVLMGLSRFIWHDALKLLPEGTAHRMSSILMAGGLILMLYMLASEMLGMFGGAVAVLLFCSVPHLFFHAHLNTFDLPAAFLWFLFVYIFRKGLARRRWGFVAGIMLGLAFLTRNQAFFLPFMVVIHLAVLEARNLKPAPRTGLLTGLAALFAALAFWLNASLAFYLTTASVGLLLAVRWLIVRRSVPRHARQVGWMIVLPPILFVALWPWLWHDTANRLGGFLMRHLNPPAWETLYLDRIIMAPPPYPWHYPFVMWGVTLPITLVLLLVAGVVFYAVSIRREAPERRDTWALIFLNAALPPLIIALPQTPVYGGTKHFMQALPFVAIVAAAGVLAIVRHLLPDAGARLRTAAVASIAAVALIPGVAGCINSQPYGIAYYNEFLGGNRGAPTHGFQMQFWGVSTAGALDWLNRECEPGALVFFGDTAWEAHRMYVTEGRLRPDIRYTHNLFQRGVGYAVVNYDRIFIDQAYDAMAVLGTDHAAASVDLNGVTLVNVFARPDR